VSISSWHSGKARQELRSGFSSPRVRRVVQIFSSSIVINLHCPNAVAALIRGACELGWPADAPLLIEDGFAFVSALPAAVQAQIAEG
jgi:hypothetical protein